jgi:hypothetical protein
MIDRERRGKMHPQEYQAIKQFKEGLEECLLNTRKTYENDNIVDKATCNGLNYAIKLLDLHLRLKELDVDRTLIKMNEEVCI